MSKTAVEPDSNTTRAIYLYLKTSEKLLLDAWAILKDLFNAGHVIPVAAINVVL